MKAGRAFIDGIVGAAIMSLVMLLLRIRGVPLDIEARLAAAFGMSTPAFGLVIFLLIGGIVALAYAAIFEWVLQEAGVGPGMLLGACNTIVAGFIWSSGGDPGRFWQHFGAAGMATLFLVHFVYGAVVGGLYHPKHRLEYR